MYILHFCCLSIYISYSQHLGSSWVRYPGCYIRHMFCIACFESRVVDQISVYKPFALRNLCLSPDWFHKKFRKVKYPVQLSSIVRLLVLVRAPTKTTLLLLVLKQMIPSARWCTSFLTYWFTILHTGKKETINKISRKGRVWFILRFILSIMIWWDYDPGSSNTSGYIFLGSTLSVS